MPKKKVKSSTVKKLNEVVNKTNLLCLDDNGDDDENEIENESIFPGGESKSLYQMSVSSSNFLPRDLDSTFDGKLNDSTSESSNFMEEIVHQELSENDIKDLSEIFSLFDFSNYGKLLLQELIRALRFLRFSVDENELTKVLSKVSLAKEVEFSFEAFLFCVVELQNNRTDWTKQILHVFQQVDTTEKGGISLDDLKTSNQVKKLGLSDQDMYKMMKMATSSDDGLIKKQDFINIMSHTNLFEAS